jgi:phage terminase Nu1 subunit (DNA packaging protein)
MSGEIVDIEYNKKRKRELEEIEVSGRYLALQRERLAIEQGRFALKKGEIELDLLRIKSAIELVIRSMSTIKEIFGELEERDKRRYQALLNMGAYTQLRDLIPSSGIATVNEEDYEHMAKRYMAKRKN